MGLFGSSKSESVDKNYNKKMAKIAKEQLRMSKEAWQIFLDVTLPYEKAVMDSNMQLLPMATDYQKGVMEEALGSFEEQSRLRAEQRAYGLEATQEARKELGRYGELSDQFYGEAMSGPRYEERMREGQADVAQGFQVVQDSLTRQAAKMGFAGDSESMVDAIARLGVERGKAIAGARNVAKKQERDDSFNKMSTAMQIGGGRSAALGQSGAMADAASTVTPGAMPGANSNFAAISQGFSGQGINAMATTKSPTVTQGYNPGIMDYMQMGIGAVKGGMSIFG